MLRFALITLLLMAAPCFGKETANMVAAQLYIFGAPAAKPNENLDEVLATVRRAGYNSVQGWVSYFETEESAEALTGLLAKHDLTMSIAYVGGTMHSQEEADRDIAEILEKAAIGAEHGLKIVAHNPQPLEREKTDAELNIQAKNLDRLGASLLELGIRLAIHQHSPEMRSKAREWYHILENTDPKKVFFCLDTHWVYRGDEDPYKLLEDAGNRTIDLHLRNSKDGVWSEDLGDGDIDYRRVAKILDAFGYEGAYTVELAYDKETEKTRSLEENLKRSREYVREVFGK